uniref:F-box domain-containing protein n=2 Tax=Panagrolaimus sp. ES5 TaxID=591445 RepID=A0AC34G6E9_9BILA
MPSLSIKSIVNLITAGTKSVDRAIQSTRRGSNKIRPKKSSIADVKIKPSKVTIPLPDECWNLICDNLSSFDQIKLRRVNKQLHGIVEKRLESQIYLDIVKCDTDEILLDEQNQI